MHHAPYSGQSLGSQSAITRQPVSSQWAISVGSQSLSSHLTLFAMEDLTCHLDVH